MKYKVSVSDKQVNATSNNIIVVKKRTSKITVALKGLESHLEKFPDSENEETLKLVKAIKRECNDELETFLDEVSSDLDILIQLTDLNNHTYENVKTGETKTSDEVGKYSYYQAWQDQFNEEDGEKDFLKYLPDTDTLVEHGNELMIEDMEDWEIIEED